MSVVPAQLADALIALVISRIRWTVSVAQAREIARYQPMRRLRISADAVFVTDATGTELFALNADEAACLRQA